MKADEIEDIEISLFLEAIYRRYGYDFRHYTRALIRSRARLALARAGCLRLSGLLPQLLYDDQYAGALLHQFSVASVELFRDPGFYQAVREQVVPYLKTYPFFKAWVAGCATGEEAYALAIVLYEEGLLERARIVATDFDALALRKAQDGVYSHKDMQLASAAYQKSGGRRALSDYYRVEGDTVRMLASIAEQITFQRHNLVMEECFDTFQIVFCRNHLISFDRSLQHWVLNTLGKSLDRGGFLCLGVKENLETATLQEQFKAVVPAWRVFQKRGAT